MAITRVAACHAAPHYLSSQATVQKAITLIREAAQNGANLVVFPESYIPGFPIWNSVRAPTENHAFFKTMVEQSLYADGEEVQALRDAAREANVIVSVGFSEKSRASTACLYNSNLIIGNTGDVLVHHRKLMPTFYEKLTWSPGDGFGLRVAETPAGQIGTLICGENTNPLARYSLMAQREEIHVSSWPPIWPTRNAELSSDTSAAPSAPSAGNYNNVLANRLRAATHCFEAKCFGVMCSGLLGSGAIDRIVQGSAAPDVVRSTLESSHQGVTMFLDPSGAPVSSFVVTADEARGTKVHRPTEFLQNDEGILYADLDLGCCVEGKQIHDVSGGYQRLDVFRLHVDRSRRDPVNFSEGV